MITFWIIVILLISFVWALISLVRDKGRKEMKEANLDLAKGRVIYHSSDSDSSESDK